MSGIGRMQTQFEGELRPIKEPRRVEMSDRAGIDSYRPGDSYLFEIAGLGGSGAISLLSAPVDVPPVTRAIEVPGATETLTFTLTEARKLSFDSLTDDSRIRWTLIGRSEEHTSELQSLMRISYAVFCLKKKKQHTQHNINTALLYITTTSINIKYN